MVNNFDSKIYSGGLGVYVHVPFCRAKCCYCGFYSEPIDRYDAGAVIEAMLGEIERYELGGGVKTIYVGGGSPSCLPGGDLLRLVERLVERCGAVEEFSVEMNPGQVDGKKLNELRGAGVNRLSIGAQSFVQRELDFLGRGYSVESIGRAVEQGRAAGFGNISLDLIFAVPGSDADSWKYNLDTAIEMGPEHVSAYGLSYEENTPLSRDLARGAVRPIDEDTDRAMFEMTIDELARAGIEQYEISNFARGGFECKHNLNYWANGSYVGIGPGATSYLQGVRRTNLADIEKYVQAITCGASAVESSEEVAGIERACETAVLNLRRRRGIELEEFKSSTGFDAMQLFAEPIEKYRQMGLIEIGGGRVWLGRAAIGIADSVLCDFAAVD